MKYLLPVIWILTLSGCRWADQATGISSSGTGNFPLPGQEIAPTDSSFMVGKLAIHIFTKKLENNLLALSATAGGQVALLDTISAIALQTPEFPDFNKDSFPDILLKYSGNTTINFLFLFDAASKKFKNIDGFINFPDAIQVKENPKYYFSYYPDGCSDLNWASDLFFIENFKPVKVAHMYGKGCDFNVLENPQFIGLYKIDLNNGQTEVLLEKLPYGKSIPENGDKWSFIEKYWNSNYRKFE